METIGQRDKMIFPISEIDQMIFNYLDILNDGKNLVLVNKHYQFMVQENSLYSALKNFYAHRKKYNIKKFLSEKGYLPSNFFKACAFGDLQVVKYLFFKFCRAIDPPLNEELMRSDIRDAFKISCEYDCVNVSEWFYSLGSINLKTSIKRMFFENCKKGNLDIAKWIYSLKNEIISSMEPGSAGINKLFSVCCKNGRLEVVKWLLSDHQIDIYANGNETFYWTCYYGHLEIAQLLYKLDQEIQKNLSVGEHVGSIIKSTFNIHEQNDILFENACNMKDYYMLRWLFSICEPGHVFPRMENNHISIFEPAHFHLHE